MLKEACTENHPSWLNEHQALLPKMTALFVDGLGPLKNENHTGGFSKLPLPKESTGIFRISDTAANLFYSAKKSTAQRAGCEWQEFSRSIEASGNRQITVRSLIGGISHHFNNLLMGIWGNATLIRMHLAVDDPLYTRVVQMERLIQSGGFLIHMVLGYLGERRTVAKRLRLNQLIMEIKNEIHDCGGNEEDPWNFEARLKWASRVQKPRMIASSTARVLEVLFQGINAHCKDLVLPETGKKDIPRKMQTIRALVDRGLDIAQQLRLYAGDVKSDARNIRLDVLVKQSIAQFVQQNPRIRVSCDIDQNLPSIIADPGQLEFALIEMFNNAVTAMPAGGDLAIRVRTMFPRELQKRCGTEQDGSDYIVIHIADTGHGISPKIQKRIFEPFYAYPLRHGRKGLGLAAVDGILSMHKGYIRFQSDIGTGTLIHIYLPASAER